MSNLVKKQGGFSLIEVVAAAALIGIMATMLMPSLSGANDRAKNARLQNDLSAIDQAIQLYRLDEGSVPDALESLTSDYLTGSRDFEDAQGEKLTYTAGSDGATYSLSGKDAKGNSITSPGSTEASGGV